MPLANQGLRTFDASQRKPTTVPMRFLPQLSLKERSRRWDALRKTMTVGRFDALLFLGNDIFWDMGLSNIRYVFNVSSKVLLYGAFYASGEPTIWNSAQHMNYPYNFLSSVQDWTHDIRPFNGLPAIASELRSRGFAKSRIGLVGYSSTIQTVSTLLAGEVEALKRELPEADLSDAGYLLERMRMVKSEEEVDMLRKAAAIGRKVLDTMVEHARPGNTEAEVFAEMIRTQIASGGEPNIFNLLTSGPVEHPESELWHLLHGKDQPAAPSMRPLEEGDVILGEWHSKYGGYLAHTEYTAYVGKKAPQQLHDIFKVCVECLDASQEALRAGNTLREAWRAIRRPCEDAGYAFVELGFHAMGVGSPEFPTVIYGEDSPVVQLNGQGIGDLILEEGMCFGNNLDIHNPAWKIDVGCMLSDFMVVRPGGAELLVNTPRSLAETL